MSNSSKKPLIPSSIDFATMAEELPDLAWMATPKGRIIWGNRRWRDFIGATQETIGLTDWAAIHDPEMLPKVTEVWISALASGDPVEMAFPLKGADGGFRMFLTRARAMRDEGGKIVFWFGINTDIGELHAATTALSEQKRLLETLNCSAADIAAELHLDRVVQIVTDAGVEITGAQMCAFFYNVTAESGEAYTLYTLSGISREQFGKFPMPRATQIFQPTFHGKGIVRADDVTQDPRYGHNAPYNGMPEGHVRVRSYLAAPVVSRHGEVLGGLFFGHPEPGRFTVDHEQLVQGLAAQAAIAIDNSRLYENAQREIADRKQAEEDRLIILRELNHRVKNLFAVAVGMVSMTARTAGTTERMVETLTGRLRALAQAHELIRPTISSSSQKPQMTTVAAMAEQILFAHLSDRGKQLRIGGPEIAVGPNGATSLALVLHELATNAAKYGGLSDPSGTVTISWRIEGEAMILDWIERGGPVIDGPSQRRGFGAELARMSARGQLGGDISAVWNPHGLEIILRASLQRLGS